MQWVPLSYVLCTVARTWGGVVPRPGITVIGAPGATAAVVIPGVRRTPGRPRGRDARGVVGRTFFARCEHVMSCAGVNDKVG